MCEPGWLFWDGSCYFVSTNRLSFIEALNECLNKKSYLLRVDEYSDYKYPLKMFKFLKHISLGKRIWVMLLNFNFLTFKLKINLDNED
jgi:hypothetical protein